MISARMKGPGPVQEEVDMLSSQHTRLGLPCSLSVARTGPQALGLEQQARRPSLSLAGVYSRGRCLHIDSVDYTETRVIPGFTESGPQRG